jgi:hypothetical protein
MFNSIKEAEDMLNQMQHQAAYPITHRLNKRQYEDLMDSIEELKLSIIDMKFEALQEDTQS